MGRPVKQRRYDATRRRAASDQTRRRILEVAEELIQHQGYAQTSVAAIASSASVHVDTVYALVGKKAEIVRELIELALSGTDRLVPALERPYVAEIRAEPDPTKKLTLYAAATGKMLARVAPLFSALRDAAGTDSTASAIWRDFSDRRACNMRSFVEDVASVNGLRPGVDLTRAADTVWLTNSPETYLMLTADRGWTPEQYEEWLADTWVQLLLPSRTC